jgi:hypothetical protein
MRVLPDVDTDERHTSAVCPLSEFVHRCVVLDVLVPIGDHCATLVPPALSNDVHGVGEERIGVAHDRPDVEVVLEVLYGNVEAVTLRIEVLNDCLTLPIAVLIKDVSAIAAFE